ncbi:periplasmic binding protein-like I [Fimicolochytrium jonesii]|uniref:periplasmic binding protein-like I n=1 Tax=Fimicolochytrium jonesii TaxID=1396493 RepID=UPI0022FDE81E|nr:periplasmic binding protein-like I [Fimicolochytrium jonesii]KAI8815819.1 periplasmic binding protein-like I [Fimicolochytrium jonesii]
MQLRLSQLLSPNAEYPVVPALQAPGVFQIIQDDCSSEGSTVQAASAIGSAIKLASVSHVNALIGVAYSGPTTAYASAAQTFNLPVCDGGSTSPSLADKTQYPNFFRSLPNDNMAGEAMIGLVKGQGYNHVGVISAVDSYGVGLFNSVQKYAEQYEITLLTTQSFIPDTTNFKGLMDQIEASGATILLFLGVHTDLLKCLAEAKRRGMVGPGYQWITGDDALYADLETFTDEERLLMNGVWASFPKEGTGAQWDAFTTAWKALYGDEPDSYSGFYSTCIESYVWAYDAALRNGTSLADLASNTHRLAMPADVSFPNRTGVTGLLALDVNSDRVAAYELFSYDMHNKEDGDFGKFLPFGNWTGISDVKEFHQFQTPVYFAGAATKAADALEIVKEYRYIAWKSGTGIFAIVLCVISVVVAAGIAGFVFSARQSMVFKPLSPPFLFTTLLGTALAAFYPLTLLGYPTSFSCTAAVWVLPTALGLVLGSLLVKSFRLFRIFCGQGFAAKSMQNPRMFIYLATCIGVYMFLAIIWSVVDAPKPQWHLQEEVSRTYYVYEYYCQSNSDAFQWILLGLEFAYTVALLVYGGFLCWVNRNLPRKFKESHTIGNLLYTYLVVFALILTILFALSLNTIGLSVIKIIACYAVIASTIGLLFVKNCYLAWVEKHQSEADDDILSSGVGMSSDRRRSTKGAVKPVGGDHNTNLAVKAGARNGTKVASVFVAVKQSFMTVWLPKQLVLYGDKQFLLIVNSSDTGPAANSNAPLCQFILLPEYSFTLSAEDAKDIFCIKLTHKKDKATFFTIRVESQAEMNEWASKLGPHCRTGTGHTTSAGFPSSNQRGGVLSSAEPTSEEVV